MSYDGGMGIRQPNIGFHCAGCRLFDDDEIDLQPNEIASDQSRDGFRTRNEASERRVLNDERIWTGMLQDLSGIAHIGGWRALPWESAQQRFVHMRRRTE